MKSSETSVPSVSYHLLLDYKTSRARGPLPPLRACARAHAARSQTASPHPVAPAPLGLSQDLRVACGNGASSLRGRCGARSGDVCCSTTHVHDQEADEGAMPPLPRVLRDGVPLLGALRTSARPPVQSKSTRSTPRTRVRFSGVSLLHTRRAVRAKAAPVRRHGTCGLGMGAVGRMTKSAQARRAARPSCLTTLYSKMVQVPPPIALARA
jgi:hypothetical protein